MNGISSLQDALPLPNPASKVHVEVSQKLTSTLKADVIRDCVRNYLNQHGSCHTDFIVTEFSDSILSENVLSISVCDTDFIIGDKQTHIDLSKSDLFICVYQLHTDGPGQEDIDGEDLAAANHWILPASDFDGMWENLIYDSSIKKQLLQYVKTTMLFSEKSIDSNIISWNRVILLHGPPGTGKTSLCKALAQKLSIHLSHKYLYGQLIEINSHSLFSKWFSESGKLVMKMFKKIQEIIDDQDAFVCVLIDEVESLTAARKAAMSGSEPSDAIRVVNAVLTQIDQIKNYPNVIILTTSNITGAIDVAFVDRADIKQYIGNPSWRAIYQIYHSCIAEMMRKKLLMNEEILDLKHFEMVEKFGKNEMSGTSFKLKEISEKSNGLSGRVIRKLPFVAYALYLDSDKTHVLLTNFFGALCLAVQKQFEERSKLS